jgi:hypothetical protein
MKTRQVAAGTVIFRTGDPSTEVYVITEGEVSIALDDGFEIVLLRSGDLFGESGVLERRPRAATATAVTATGLLVTEAATFAHAFGMDNERALSLVKLLCRRLRTTSVRAAHADGGGGQPMAGTDHAPILLLPDHPRLATEFAMTAIDVAHLPFQVGNRFGAEDLPLATNRSCNIPARGDAELAAPHFEITRRGGLVGVHDLGSRWGTIVNGTVISRTSSASFVPLHPGGNRVTAGRAASPFRFRVQVTGV